MTGLTNRDFVDDLPAEWTEKRADFLCELARRTVEPKLMEADQVWHYSIPNVQDYGDAQLEDAASIESSKVLIETETLLVSKLNPRKKTICIAAPRDENPSVASSEFVAVLSDQMDRRYALYVWSSEKVTDRLSAIVQSVTRSHQRVNPADILKLPWRWPDLDTQRRIAGFLDDRTARIDGLIGRKRALLDRLAEKRQALVTRAVTQGLNPAAPMKDSGIGWLGRVPAHWEVKQLKYITPKVSVGIVVTPASWYAEEGILALRGLNIRPMGFDFQETRLISDEGHEFHRKSELREGDLVSVRTGDPGTTAVVTKVLEGSNCIDLVIIRRPFTMLPKYLGWFLNSDVAKVQYQLGSEGALQAHFNVDTSKETLVTVPPIDEQGPIIESLERSLMAHDLMVGKICASVDKLTEYRAALVTAAVTGKVKV